MKSALVIGILFICVYNVTTAPSVRREVILKLTDGGKADLLKVSNAARKKLEDASGTSFPPLSWNEDLVKKIPDFTCDKDPEDDLKNLLQELKKEKSQRKVYEKVAPIVDKSPISCSVSTRTEVACTAKPCHGGRYANCICGPLGSFTEDDSKSLYIHLDCKANNECDDEDDGSSNLFTVGTILNMIVLYLISSFI